jgi:hypothetical protein
MTATIKTFIKAPIARVFRRASVKRRDAATGLFESEWQDISSDVKSYGRIVSQIDTARRNKFTFGNAKLTLSNETGLYSPHDVPSSLWYGYLNQQRSLVKLEAGFQQITQDANGVYSIGEFPSISLWDAANWDADSSIWDGSIPSTVFTGLISGDIPLSDKNEVVLNLKPLTSIFQDYPARNLTGWTSTGMTASNFVTMLRDQTDGAGSFVFRPFLGDTTSNWDISTTSNVFANLNTSTAADVVDKNAWEIVEKLAEAENFVPYITRAGVFKFVSRSAIAATVAFEFHGSGSFSGEYGQTIKKVDSYGFKISNYYSRVQIKWNAASTSTSYEVVESTLTVSGVSNPWVLGARTLALENLYIQTSTVANTLAQAIYNDVSALKKEIQFTTTFVPHLDLFDRFSIHYDPAAVQSGSLWDGNTWPADATNATTDLILDSGEGDALVLEGEEFKFLSFEIDLDNFENRFLAREV